MIKQDQDELNKMKEALGAIDKSVDPTVGAGMSMDEVVDKLLHNQQHNAPQKPQTQSKPQPQQPRPQQNQPQHAQQPGQPQQARPQQAQGHPQRPQQSGQNQTQKTINPASNPLPQNGAK